MSRLMILLAVVDTVFLLSSCLTFSLPRLSQTYAHKHWAYLLPYTLPIAQVTLNESIHTSYTLYNNIHPITKNPLKTDILVAFILEKTSSVQKIAMSQLK